MWVKCNLYAAIILSCCWMGLANGAEPATGEAFVPRQELIQFAFVRKLDEPADFQFVENPLIDVVEFLEDRHGVMIEIDSEAALDAVGIGSDVPITIDVNNISLKSALHLILRPLDLTYVINYRERFITIKAIETVEREVLVRVYRVDRLLADSTDEYLLTLLRNTLREPKGSLAAAPKLQIYRGCLLAAANDRQHQKLRDFLTTLRIAMKIELPHPRHPLDGWRAPANVNLQNLSLHDADLAYLAGQTQIEELRLSGNKGLRRGIEHLAGLKNLTYLSLRGTSVSDADLASLANLPRLETLDLNNTNISGAGLVHLKSCPRLENLYLIGAPLRDISQLRHLKNVRMLDVSSTPLGDDGWESLGQMTGLETLMMQETKVTGMALAPLENLQHLDLGSTPLQKASQLHHLKHLRSLNVSYTPFGDKDVEDLEALSKLETLRVTYTRLTDAAVEPLARLKQLKSLSLGGSYALVHEPLGPKKPETISKSAADKLRKLLPDCKLHDSSLGTSPDPFGTPADPFAAPNPFDAEPPKPADDPFAP